MSETNYNTPDLEKRKETKLNSETKGEKRKYREGSLFSTISDIFDKMSLARLFLIFSFIVYGIIVYSKKERGVEVQDLSIFIAFSVFAILFFCFLTTIKKIYYEFNQSCAKSFKNLINFLRKNLKIIIITIILILLIILLVFLKNTIINFLNLLIGYFI